MNADSSSAGPSHGNWQKYTRAGGLQRRLIERFLATVVELAESTGAATIVDAGCAEGFVTAHLGARLRGVTFTGCDIDRQALARGRLIHPAFASQQADVRRLPYRSKSADLVLCLEVLEHLDEPAEALAELRRVARGHCLLSVPHEPFFRLANLARGKNLARWGDDPDHRQHWSRESFAALLGTAGLDVRVVRGSFPWLVALAEART